MKANGMKQKNEEILDRWRGLGLLNGLKEGSINEWRCAKSFENIAHYILDSKDIKSASLGTFAFPFVRKVLCTGKKRLYRILTGEEVCDFLTSVTVKECLERARKRIKTELGKSMLKIIDNYLEYADKFMTASNASLVDFFDELKYNKFNAGGLLYVLMKDVFDFEAELLASATDIFVDKSSVK